MEPSTTIQLRHQLEAIKEFERKNAPSKMSYYSYWVELLVGIIILGRLIVNPIKDSEPVVGISIMVGWLFFGLALFLICHALYLILRRNLDKRFRLLLEAVLSPPQP